MAETDTQSIADLHRKVDELTLMVRAFVTHAQATSSFHEVAQPIITRTEAAVRDISVRMNGLEKKLGQQGGPAA